jgi:hypothetical protein
VFTFQGTVAEAVNRAPNFFRRNHNLTLRVLILDRCENWADAAVLTRLERTDDAVGGAVGVVTGQAAKESPPLVRIDLVRIHSDGTVHLILPSGPPPLSLDRDTPARALPLLPLDTFCPAEFGVFPPKVPPGETDEPWTIASGGGRPSETWQAKGYEFMHAERCRLLIGNQMSADWLKPVGGQTAWHRADAVWVSTQDGTARKVHRVIRQRDGNSETPAAWVEVKYELKDHARLGGRTFERNRNEAEIAYAALAEAALLAPDAARLNPKLFETRLAKLDAHIEEVDHAGPYHEALLAARRLLDDARCGRIASLQPIVTTAVMPPTKPAGPEPGQLAPDFTSGNFRLAEHKGKPVVLVFFRPGGETTDLSLSIANALEKRYGGRAAVVPLVVFGEMSAANAARDRLKFPVQLYSGAAVAAPYGVETVPRFILIDGVGKVRWTFAGVGAETGFLLKEEVDRLVNPASPIGAGGITPAPAPVLPPIVPRP